MIFTPKAQSIQYSTPAGPSAFNFLRQSHTNTYIAITVQLSLIPPSFSPYEACDRSIQLHDVIFGIEVTSSPP